MFSIARTLLRPLLVATVVSVAFVPTAFAGAKDQPTSVGDLDSYSFVVEKDGKYTRTMRIKDRDLGVLGDSRSGFIIYDVITHGGKNIVMIRDIKGIREIKGVGKTLKKEVLRRFPKREVTSDLVDKNYETLLKAWAKRYPHKSGKAKAESLRKTVPALQFEGFIYTIKAVPKAGGGRIELKMKRARKGSKGRIIVENAADLDKILVAAVPQYIPASKRPMSAEENEDNAEDAMELLEELAEEVSDDEGVDEDDLLEHLVEAMEDECGNGGSSGSGWADECQFTSKGGKITVSPKRGKSFKLEGTMEDEAEDFVDDNK